MKMVSISIILISFSLRAYSPENKTLPVVEAEKIHPFDPLLYATQKVESNFDCDTINYLGYTGILQEGQEMIDEANRINAINKNPIRFTFPESALDSAKAVQVWYTVQDYWNPSYSVRKACKIWNPLATIEYYNKIKHIYEKERKRHTIN